jgi:hypothetical protein
MLTNTKSWIVRDAVISSRGAKSCQIEHTEPDAGGDSKIKFNIASMELPSKTPFGATTFNNEISSQKTIEFHLTDGEMDQMQGLVEWLADYLSKHSERIFRKSMSREQVFETIRNPVTQRSGYLPHIRCKIRPSSVRVWDSEGKARPLPDDLRQYNLVPRITIEKLWIMSRECGLVLQVSDLMILDKEEMSCPFT